MYMQSIRFGRLLRTAQGQLVTGLVVALVAVGVASAHVTVNPPQVGTSTLATFTVRVPTEKDVPTVRLRIEFPSSLIVARFQPAPGWKRAVEKDSAGRIIAATWSGGQIASDEYEDFAFLARTPKDPGKLTFKAYQTYQDGETVAWVGPENADSPAPVVEVTAAGAGSGPSASVEGPAVTGATTAATSAAGTETSVGPLVTVTAVATSPAATTVAQSAATGDTTTAQTAGAIPGTTAVAALDAASGATAASSGSDLPLFTSLTALVVAVLGLALAGIALARRRGTA